MQPMSAFNVKITLMKLLALDASTEFLSLAIRDGEQLYTYDTHAGQAASQLILPQIQQLLTQANIALTDLDGIVFGAGPGSFTGVRVACGVAQGLGFGANLPVVGVNVLTALAEAAGAERVVVATDARMKEVYHAAYIRKNQVWRTVHDAGVYKPNEVPSLDGDDWTGVGTAWQVYDAVLSDCYQGQIVKKLPELTPAAAAMLTLAQPVFAAGEARPASEAKPVYIRNRVALTSKEREQGLRL